MSKNSGKFFFIVALLSLLISGEVTLIAAKEEMPDNQGQTINAMSTKEYYKNVVENIAPTKIYVYGIDLIEYYMIKDSSLIQDVGMHFWTTDVGLDSGNYTKRLYFTTEPISEEKFNKYELYKYFIYLGEMPAPLFRVYEHIEGHPSVYYVTNNPNTIAESLVPIVDPNSEIYVAYDLKTREFYLTSSIKADEIRKGKQPDQVVFGLYDRDFAYENLSPEVEYRNMVTSLFLECYRNAEGPEVEQFFKLFKQIYNSRA